MLPCGSLKIVLTHFNRQIRVVNASKHIDNVLLGNVTQIDQIQNMFSYQIKSNPLVATPQLIEMCQISSTF
jgi:hypothetical protein